MCLSVYPLRFVCPLGDKHFSHTGKHVYIKGGRQTFLHRGGGQTFHVGGSGGNDDVDVDEEMDVSKVSTLLGTRNFRCP